MSNKLITDTFPKVKKQRIVKENFKTTQNKEQKIAGKVLYVPQQERQEKNLQLLKEFDMTLEYGPCIGITRMERWERADKFGLHPPQIVKDIISKKLNDEIYTECIWNKEKL
ncbi:hypothetical protein QZH41_019134 [Actinostola sp. cb2023]|nr:hypothetical protein QZH41_019134 [Actinostola sp. cb2023]